MPRPPLSGAFSMQYIIEYQTIMFQMIDAVARGLGMPRPYNTIGDNFLYSLKFLFQEIAHLLSAHTIIVNRYLQN